MNSLRLLRGACLLIAAIVTAPLRVVERARGRRRIVLVLLYAGLVLVGSLYVWRLASLRNLPDIGDPFDVADFRAGNVADTDNAYLFYEQAARRIHTPLDPATGEPFDGIYDRNAWMRSTPGARAWLESNREALELWRQGTQRDKAWPRTDRERLEHPLWFAIDSHALFVSIACLEGSRLECEGQMAQAWDYYKAVLRASRHQRADGNGTPQACLRLRRATSSVHRWAADPRVDASLLRRALRDALAADALTPPDAVTVKRLYLELLDELARDRDARLAPLKEADTSLVPHLFRAQETRWFMLREPERSRRVARFIYSNWLDHLAHDPSAKPDITARAKDLAFWSPSSGPVARIHAHRPDALLEWYETTIALKQVDLGMTYFERWFAMDRRFRSEIIRTVAEQLYAREHDGTIPESDQALQNVIRAATHSAHGSR